MTQQHDEQHDGCSYSLVWGDEQWCDTHDSTFPCPGTAIDEQIDEQQEEMTCEHCNTRFLPGSHFVCAGRPVFSVEGIKATAGHYPNTPRKEG